MFVLILYYQINTENKIVYMMGDFNIDLVKLTVIDLLMTTWILYTHITYYL